MYGGVSVCLYQYIYINSVYINGTTVDSVMVDANSHVYNGLISSTTRTSVYSFQVIAMYPSVSSSSNIVSIETGELVIFLFFSVVSFL